MTRAKAGAELKRCEKQKEHTGKNVNQREVRIGLEGFVEIAELRGDGIGSRGRWWGDAKNNRRERDHAADDDRAADERQEAERNPESAMENGSLHIGDTRG
jgi:hypothetical protein